MSKTAFGLGVVVLIAGAAAFYVQNRANSALRHEIAGLREDIRTIAVAVKDTAATSPRPVTSTEGTIVGGAPAAGAATGAVGEDLAKLREEIVALRKSTTVLTQFAQTVQAAQALAKSSESVATKLVPVAEWRNVGKATPEAGVETALTAATGGDVDTLAASLMFTDSARSKADAWFAGLSESTRQQYGSPEKVIALMIARDAEGLSGMQVLGQKEVSPDNVGVRMRFASVDGKTKDDTFLMRRANDGWRMVLPDAVVEKYAKKLGGGR